MPSNHDSASKLVARNMATYSSISFNNKGAMPHIDSHVCYPSEPVLVEASAYCTSKFLSRSHHTKVAVLNTVLMQIKSSSGIVKLSKGDIGEMMSCAIIGYSLDSIREKRIDRYRPGKGTSSMRRLVSVVEFLQNILPTDFHLPDGVINHLKEFSFNTTHFVRLPASALLGTCLEAIKRGAGVVTAENCRGLDLFMEMFQVRSLSPEGADDDASSCEKRYHSVA